MRVTGDISGIEPAKEGQQKEHGIHIHEVGCHCDDDDIGDERQIIDTHTYTHNDAMNTHLYNLYE